ncbi:MAG: tRNA (guanosine(37)-N1)-methyltransferase TrmD [Bacteroidota bacterium]|nr:tRNA (guanosine(37)-N1)-methyltransferase TrmD [Bacteroidota bacterium]
MRIDIISVMPQLLEGPFTHSILKRAQDKNLAEIYLHDLKNYSSNKHHRVDDYQYGGGAGMVIQIEPVDKIISQLTSERTYDEIIFTTPDGEVYNQAKANYWSGKKNFIILCGHYKGIDQRIRDKYITSEISVGDYVLTGGELAAAVIADSIVRLIPGVISDETSALSDSFQDNLLSPPVYTRPAEYKGMKVPAVLLSGNFAKIDKWRMDKAVEKTENRRPDLLEQRK